MSPNRQAVRAGFTNDIWGWTSSAGQEIAIVGCSTGTSYVDITDPYAPRYIGFLGGSFSYWRDVKVYRDYAYIGSEATNHGIQVMAMQDVAADALLNRTGVMYSPVKTYYGVGK